MAAIAGKKGNEGNPIMTFAAVLAPKNIDHAYFRPAGLCRKGVGVAIRTG
jgi:hypothetical protein